jgi:hypothetical protein
VEAQVEAFMKRQAELESGGEGPLSPSPARPQRSTAAPHVDQ